jgi:hypothetical protein
MVMRINGALTNLMILGFEVWKERIAKAGIDITAFAGRELKMKGRLEPSLLKGEFWTKKQRQ